MLRIDTTIYCSDARFKSTPATYKIAAEWNGGDYYELKTYGFANDECLLDVYRAAVDRASRFRPCEGESLGELHIYRLNPSQHDYDLRSDPELESDVKRRLAK